VRKAPLGSLRPPNQKTKGLLNEDNGASKRPPRKFFTRKSLAPGKTSTKQREDDDGQSPTKFRKGAVYNLRQFPESAEKRRCTNLPQCPPPRTAPRSLRRPSASNAWGVPSPGTKSAERRTGWGAKRERAGRPENQKRGRRELRPGIESADRMREKPVLSDPIRV